MQLRSHISDKRGMSLVEVLAALSVFVIGILVIVRLFPPGFFIVKQSENVTLANRLAQSELERLKGTTLNLPAGILGWDIVTGSVLIDMDPEDMGELPELSNPGITHPHDPYYYSDVNKFRRIYSESTKIPAPMATRFGFASMYVMNFSPIEWRGDDSVIVKSGPMRRRSVVRDAEDRQRADEGRLVRSSSDYAIDYREAVLYVAERSYDREYIISYSYWSRSSGRPDLLPVLSARVHVPAGAFKVQIPDGAVAPAHVKSASGFTEIDGGSETVHRSFARIAHDADFDLYNPYQYKVMDQHQGILAFNPLGYGYEEVTAWGRVALTAYIDYDVLDWHIIREERKLPEGSHINSPADLDVKLTLRYIKNAGLQGAAPPIRTASMEFDGSTYAGLSADLQFSILAVDIQNGYWYNEETVLDDGNWAMVVDYKDGIIRFHRDLAGRTFRIYYRAEGDWALQVFKSYESYRRSYNSAALDHRQWFAQTASASDSRPYFVKPTAGQGVIFFAKCYHGMSIAIDYTYRVNTSDGYRYFSVDGDTYQTDKTLGGSGTCAIDPLKRLAKLRGVAESDIEILDISKVYGVSVGSRVIWREGSRGFSGGQWKTVSLQTYLMRLQD